MKRMNYPALAVLAALVASTLMVRGDNPTRAETGRPRMTVVKGSYNVRHVRSRLEPVPRQACRGFGQT